MNSVIQLLFEEVFDISINVRLEIIKKAISRLLATTF